MGPALVGTYDLALDGRPNVPDVDVPGPRHLVLEHVADSSCARIDRAREQRNACQTADQARNALQFDQLDVKAVAEALASLPAPLRQATWLRDVDNASYTEIAATLNVPVETVLSHISRGRRTRVQSPVVWVVASIGLVPRNELERNIWSLDLHVAFPTPRPSRKLGRPYRSRRTRR